VSLSRPTSDSADGPWLYPFRQSPQSTIPGQASFRPFVSISMAYLGQTTAQLAGLVDTGAPAVLASGTIADQLGIDLDENEGEGVYAIGGHNAVAKYKTVDLSLHPADADEGVLVGWRAPVGFLSGWPNDGFLLLGIAGFLDQFTVTVSVDPPRQTVAIEPRDAFRARFGTEA
jgi:hypothetical protein